MLATKKPDAEGRERLILTETGTKSQSVNLCSPANQQGQYEGWVYFKPPFMVDEAWFGKYPMFEAVKEALRERSYRQTVS